jgi:hypothetical protein
VSCSTLIKTQRDLLPDDPFEAALVMHAESLVRAENQAQQQMINTVHDETMIMMDMTRDGAHLFTSYSYSSVYNSNSF